MVTRTKKSPINFRLYFGIFVVLIAGFLVYNHLSVQANKKNFQEARTSIDSIYSSVISALGEPDASKRLSSCGGSQCTVYTSLVYGVSDKNQANEYFAKIQAKIKNQSAFVPAKPLSTSLASANGFDTAQDLYADGKLSCTSKYTYNPPQVTLLQVKSASSKPLYIEIGCTGSAKKSFYPSSSK